MKIGDLVTSTVALGNRDMEDWLHVIIGPGIEDWDWELYHPGNDTQRPFTWFAVESELELVNEDW
jgi:hypothetical protein